MSDKSTKQRHVSAANRLRRYGLSVEDGNMLLERQGSGCPICEDWFTNATDVLVVDHYHRPETKCITANDVRGLLCASCNSGLGQFADNIPRMITAINFLSHYKKRGFAWNGGDACYICRDFKAKLLAYRDAETGNRNGNLCFKCKSGLGLFKHNEQNLRNAIAYLMYWHSKPSGCYWRTPEAVQNRLPVPAWVTDALWEDTPWYRPDGGFPAFWNHRHNCYEHQVPDY